MDARPLVLLCWCGALLACARAAPARGAVTLSQAEVTHLGVVLAPAAAADYAAETEGYALVLGSDVFAQPLTELITARAAARQSHAAQARMQRLAGTPRRRQRARTRERRPSDAGGRRGARTGAGPGSRGHGTGAAMDPPRTPTGPFANSPAGGKKCCG